MLKYTLILALLFTSCASREQKQAAADGIAGTKAAAILIDVNKLVEAKQTLDSVIHYQLAAINEPFAALPAPAMTPQQIAANVKQYSDAAPPEPTPSSPWGLLTGTALAVLWGVGRVAPGIPGLGPLVGKTADMVWEIIANRNQKQAEAISTEVTSAAKLATPVIEWVVMNHAALPEHIRTTITPDTLKSLAVLATALSTNKKA
jgi:hypothetical protein